MYVACSQLNVPCSTCSLQNRSPLIGTTVLAGRWVSRAVATGECHWAPRRQVIYSQPLTVYKYTVPYLLLFLFLSERMVLCSVGGWWYRTDERDELSGHEARAGDKQPFSLALRVSEHEWFKWDVSRLLLFPPCQADRQTDRQALALRHLCVFIAAYCVFDEVNGEMGSCF
jgi:hypothetical protein